MILRAFKQVCTLAHVSSYQLTWWSESQTPWQLSTQEIDCSLADSESTTIRSSGALLNSLPRCLVWLPLCFLFETETLEEKKIPLRWLLFKCLRIPLEVSLIVSWQPFCASHIKVPETAGGISSALLSTSPVTINTQQCVTGCLSKTYRDADNRFKVWTLFGFDESKDFQQNIFVLLLRASIVSHLSLNFQLALCSYVQVAIYLCTVQHTGTLPESRVAPHGQIISLSSLLKYKKVCD